MRKAVRLSVNSNINIISFPLHLPLLFSYIPLKKLRMMTMTYTVRMSSKVAKLLHQPVGLFLPSNLGDNTKGFLFHYTRRNWQKSTFCKLFLYSSDYNHLPVSSYCNAFNMPTHLKTLEKEIHTLYALLKILETQELDLWRMQTGWIFNVWDSNSISVYNLIYSKKGTGI